MPPRLCNISLLAVEEEEEGKCAKALKQGIRARLLVGTTLVSHIPPRLFKQPP